jgi:hypothetical protein
MVIRIIEGEREGEEEGKEDVVYLLLVDSYMVETPVIFLF